MPCHEVCNVLCESASKIACCDVFQVPLSQLTMCRQPITRWAGSGRNWDVSHGRLRNYSSFLVLYIVLHSNTSGCTAPNHGRAYSTQIIKTLLPGSCAAKLRNARPIELPWGSSKGDHEAISSRSRISQVSKCLGILSCCSVLPCHNCIKSPSCAWLFWPWNNQLEDRASCHL